MTSSLLFVCTGNICRSPTADGIMRQLAPHFTIDSAGTHAYHIGEAPDRRSQQVAKARGYDLSALRGRKATAADFKKFDLILAMDTGHLHFLQKLRPQDATAKLALFCEYTGLGVRDVPDPYYGSAKDFEACFELVEMGCKNIKLSSSHLMRGSIL